MSVFMRIYSVCAMNICEKKLPVISHDKIFLVIKNIYDSSYIKFNKSV